MIECEKSHEELEAYRLKLQEEVKNLFGSESTVPMQDIVHILGAKEFLTIDTKRKVLTFDAKRYVDSLVKRLRNEGLKLQLPKKVEIEPEVVFPPGEGEIKTGSEAGIEKKKEFQRNALLIELLSENQIPYETPRISKTTPDMMRGEGYTVYFLPTLQKTVCVNNEEGNTTIILFDTQSYDDAKKIFGIYTKKQLRTDYNGLAVCIDWKNEFIQNPKLWKVEILNVLQSEPLSKKMGSTDKEIMTRRRTIETAQSELEEAYIKWLNSQNQKNKRFNIRWLQKNGYNALEKWIRRNEGLDALVRRCPPELQEAFEKRDHTSGRTTENAQAELEQAFEQWLKQPVKGHKKFNTVWLLKNGYGGLYEWTRSNESLDVLVRRCPSELQEAFEKRIYTFESAQAELEQAFEQWLEQPVKGHKKFNTVWLLKNGYGGLYEWTRSNESLDALVRRCPPVLQEAFEKRDHTSGRTTESAQAELEQAFEQWLEQPVKGHKKFNTVWLLKNGYGGLYEWTRKNKNLDTLVQKCSQGLQVAFNKFKKK
ncbi:MAG: hypothetical protein HYV41_05500 [Candidatus Magasanikbacteria bacterium]|nr:hypothetical protein [Candidatus Magasanikbacteria bacterium]